MLTKVAEKVVESNVKAMPGVDTRVPPYVRIFHGGLDEDAASPGGIILHGRIDPSTFRFLKVDPSYQRDLESRADIFDAIKSSVVLPPVEIGVRGQDFVSDGDDYLIRSPAYIVDGYQRIGNAERVLELIPDLGVRMYAQVHFGTDQAWELKRFREVNKNRKKVSADLHFRNLRNENEAVATLYGLSNNTRDFPLFKKVCWSQNMRRGELLKALVLGKTAVVLHAHQTALRNGTADAVADSLLRAVGNISLPTFRKNVFDFFSLINECWPLVTIEYRRQATQLKSVFLSELARVLSEHGTFWDHDRVLTVCADDRRKLGKFPIKDPHVQQLAASSGKARNVLYQLLVDHMNSGRRTNRLVKR